MTELQELQQEVQETSTIEQANKILDGVDARAAQVLIMSNTALRKALLEPAEKPFRRDEDFELPIVRSYN